MGAVVGAFVLIMAMVAADRAANQNQPAKAAKEKATGTKRLAAEIAGQAGADAIVPPDVPGDPAPEKVLDSAPGVIVAAPPAGGPPLPPSAGGMYARPAGPGVAALGPAPGTARTPRDAKEDELRERIRQMRLQKAEEAAKARTTVQMQLKGTLATTSAPGAMVGSSTPPRTREEAMARLADLRARANTPSPEFQAKVAALTNTAEAGVMRTSANIGGGQSTAAGAASRDGYSQFSGAGQQDRWRLDASPEAPRSPYELRAGAVIPAVLIGGINSELAGQISGQVTQSVYDTATGRYLLIPQGSRLVGRYSSDVAYGQARVLVAWQRIVFPDGKALDIGAMPGADSAGYSGFKDSVDNHYLRLFGGALLMSGITAGITYSQGQNNQNSGTYGAPSASSALSQALGQQLGQVTAQLISKNMNIAPTIEIRPGYRFNVVVTKDVTFVTPYKPFDYQ